MRAVGMYREMRDISGDLRERADLLVRQMVAEQARFRKTLTELEKEKAMRRQQLEAAVQAVHRLVNVITVQHVLHRALNSAVTALDAQGLRTPPSSNEPLPKKESRVGQHIIKRNDPCSVSTPGRFSLNIVQGNGCASTTTRV
jgi:hypothetical protein